MIPTQEVTTVNTNRKPRASGDDPSVTKASTVGNW